MLTPAQIKTKIVQIETDLFFFFSDAPDVFVRVSTPMFLPQLQYSNVSFCNSHL